MKAQTRLDSWKEIARYLGRDVRTVMRWESERQLPVHRMPGAKRSVVFAHVDELDAWLARSAEPGTPEPTPVEAAPEAVDPAPAKPPAPRKRLRWIAGAAITIAGIVSVVTVGSWNRDRTIQSVVVKDNILSALNARGDVLWTHTFAVVRATLRGNTRPWTPVGDLDDDGRPEIAVVVTLTRTEGVAAVDALHCFGGGGRLLWTHEPSHRLQFGDKAYGTPWHSSDLLAFGSPGQTRLAWAFRHHTWWPSVLETVDLAGRPHGAFVNAGWMTSLAAAPDGRLLLAAGVNNARAAMFLAVLDPQRLEGSSPEAPGEFACASCSGSGPPQYFVFPRSDVSEHSVFPPPDPPSIQVFAGGAVHVRVPENGGPSGAETIYEFSPTLVLERARVTDWFWHWHRRLSAEGRLDHDERACPLRKSIGVRHWTPAGGWKVIPVPAG